MGSNVTNVGKSFPKILSPRMILNSLEFTYYNNFMPLTIHVYSVPRQSLLKLNAV